MSRIREARKTLEVEEGSFHQVQADQQADSEMRPIPVNHVGDPIDSNSPSAQRELACDARLSDCGQTTWSPDPQMILSFEGMEEVRATEEFRSLRSRLYRCRKEGRLKSILVSSAVQKEGRSFVAVNLAQVLALQAECRVLLIDADLRNPRLHAAFGTSSSPGISEFLLQEAGEFAVMQKGGPEGLFLIPAGRSVPGPTELLANGRLKLLIDEVESLFDWIIVDSSAANSVSDASLVGSFCDGVLLVVRSNSTPFDLVRKAQEKFREESVVGVVLNHIAKRSSLPTRQGPAPAREVVRDAGLARGLYAEE
jgi:capsular exopolysaccharide synthesis family protein